MEYNNAFPDNSMLKLVVPPPQKKKKKKNVP